LLDELDGSSAGSFVTGLKIAAGNSTVRGLIINRFGGHGIEVSASGGNTMACNFIGTDATGTMDLGNGADGILISGASSNTIGGTASGARNLISGNGGGVEIRGSGATGNQVQGNYIGTDVSGTMALGNSFGVFIFSAPNNTIGGTASGAGNLISGNNGDSVQIFGSSGTMNQVQGNYIGTDVSGTADLGNARFGVYILDAPSNTIGGTASGARNVISGNTYGVAIEGDGATVNQVQGNYIGTDVSGTMDLGNASFGVWVVNEANNNTIGGTASGAGNVISGNDANGVEINGTTMNKVQGNYIGTDVTGAIDLGNTFNGVFITDTANNIIGGTSAEARNLISGNGDSGVRISACNRIQVLGNYIGTQADGISPLGNASFGVVITTLSAFSIIGGTAMGAGNTIAFNGNAGVVINSNTGHRVERNSIHDNTGLGIDLGNNGMTANDPNDPDSGVNELQNFPVLTSATSSGGSTTISGTLNSTASTTFTLEFFANAACDPSGHGEGAMFLGSTAVTTVGNDASFTATFSGTVPVGHVVTATATDPNGNTSEFSACVTVQVGLGCAITCPANITQVADPGQCGAIVSFAPMITGPCGSVTCTPASGSFFQKGTTTVTCTTTAGASCSFMVTVTDAQPPMLTCPGNITTNSTSSAGAVVTFTATATDNCAPAPTVTCTPPSGSTFPIGTTTVTCTAMDAGSNSANCPFTVTVTGPSITVQTPNGGEVWPIGSVQTIQWTSNGITGNVKIRLSRNGGANYSAIFNSVSNTGSIQWTVAGPATTQARIQVVSLTDLSIRDSSDANFTIGSQPPPPANSTLTVATPNGGETWPVGSTQTIQWSSTNVSGNVKIELSRSGAGGPFETLLASTTNDGAESWTVSGSVTSQAMIKISSVNDPSVSDMSNGGFTINQPSTVTVLTPNGDEVWRLGSVQTIRWMSSGVTGQVKIRLSVDGGASYRALFNSVPNTGSIQWTVTGATSSQCKIQVVSVADSTIRDASDGVFSIAR
jgi:hypothetical protein